MEATVSVELFEGPLGLLLELVEANKLEITAISIATITSQYLARIEAVANQRDLAQFVELGARLLYIKSAALLPPENTEPEASPQAVLHRLNEELEAYREIRNGAHKLNQRAKVHGGSYSRSRQAVAASTQLPFPQVELAGLAAAFQAALRNVKPVATLSLSKRSYDQLAIRERLADKLARGRVLLSDVTKHCQDRLEIVVTFLAVLELVRRGQAVVRQTDLFEDIALEAAGE